MKKIVFALQLVFVGLFFASFVLAIGITNPISADNFADLIIQIVGGVTLIISPVLVIMFVFSGILYLTSAGNPERINSAKACVVYAIIGTVIVISAEGLALYLGTIFT